MKIPEDAAVYEATVPFHDCDPLSIVWHGHYYKYLEHARTELLQRYRLDMPDFIELRRRLVVIESKCRHIYPLRYGERFRVRAWIVDYDMRLHLAYEIWNVTQDRRTAKAWTTLVVTDMDGTMLLETPPDVRERIEAPPAGEG